MQNYTPEMVNLFVRVVAKRRAHEAVQAAGITAVGVGAGMSGKREGLMKFMRKMLRGHEGSGGQAGGDNMATFRERLNSMLPGRKE